MEKKEIQRVLEENTDQWMSIPGVVGTAEGLCNGQPCIRILVDKKTPDLLQKIAKVLDGYAIEIDEVGDILAFPDHSTREQK